MKHKPLSFEKLAQSFELIEFNSLFSILGGLLPANGDQIVRNGISYTYNSEFGGWVGDLPEVVVNSGFVGSGYFPRWESSYSNVGSWVYSEYEGSGGGGTGGTGSGPGGYLPEIGIEPELTKFTLFNAVSWLISSVDLTLSGTAAAANALNVGLPTIIGLGGVVTSVISVGTNVYQIQEEGFNWNDASQLALGAVVIGTAVVATVLGTTVLAPAIFIGGVGLFVWELAEEWNGW